MKRSQNASTASNGPSSKRKSLAPTKEEEQQIANNAELQRLVFNLTEDPSDESLKALKHWNDTIRPSHIDLKVATNLVNVVIRLVGQREHKIYGKPSKEAQLALELLFDFAKQVEEVQDAIEALSTGDLRRMRLHKQVLELEDEPQNTAIRFVHFLMDSFPKCSQLKDFISDDVKEVSATLIEKRELVNQSDAVYRQSFDEKAPNTSPTYFDADVETVVALFKTSVERGLTNAEVLARREHYGQNLLPKPKKKSIWRMLWNQVFDIMILILVVAVGASAAIGDYKAMGALAAVIVINIIIGFTQEYKAEKALNALLKLDVPTARVLRNGEVDTLQAAELVPGDIVLLEEGVAIPADIRLCEAINLQVIEAILTGESTAIEKNTTKMAAKKPPLGDRLNMGYMVTVVVKGRGKGIVVTTGASTEMGKISLRLNSAKSPKTPLQKRLTKLGIILVIVAVVLCAIIIVVGFARGNYWLDMLRVGVSLAVSVIPEGLVAVTTVTMAIGVSRMSKHNVLVRQLHAVETLGSITTICSDKTGTLTEGKMSAKKVWVSGKEYRVKGRSTDPKDTNGKFSFKNKEDETEEINRDIVPEDLRILLMGAGLCNNTSLVEDEEGKTIMAGDPTEIALHICAIKVGLGKERFIEEGFTFVNEHSFDSDRKRMSVVYKNADKYFCLAKGAPEGLLKKSTHYLSKSKPKSLEKRLKKIEKQGAKMAGQGLRILAFGYKTYNLDEKTDDDFKNVDLVENDLCFVGLIGLLDPPRKNVNNVIKQCRDAGIRVCMITGDHPSTAKAIAIKIGIATEESSVLTGEQIDLLYESKQLGGMDPFPTVFARVSPDNKLEIVETLQSKGEVVAMTGDGVNDAPAIKKSDCGVAMGITGTDITKQAASIVLTDDDIKSIVYAVQEGRRIYDNIKKFIIYLLSCNTAEILTMLIAVIIAAPIPFAPIQILWANIIADIPPAMALGIDPSELDVMARKPRNPKQGIFTVRSGFVLLAQGASMAGLALATLLIGAYVENYELPHLQSVTFTVLTMTQLWHAFLSRSQTQSIFVTGLIGNRWLIGAYFLSASLLIMSIYIPGFNTFFELVPLNGYDWIKVAASMVIHTAIMELIKGALRIRAHFLRKKAKPHMFYNDV